MTLRSASAERSTPAAGWQLLREYLLGVDADRPKHIDDYIDFFGNGRERGGIPRGHASGDDGGRDGSCRLSPWRPQ